MISFSLSVLFDPFSLGFTQSIVIKRALLKWFKKETMLALTWFAGSGNTRFFDSSSSSVFSTAAAPLLAAAPFLASAFAGGLALPPLTVTCSSRSFLRIRSRFSFNISSYSSVRCSPAFCFFKRRKRCLLLAAFSPRPGSAVSQLVLSAFSRSSLSVSLTSAKVSELNIFMVQVIPYVISLAVLHSGNMWSSKTA